MKVSTFANLALATAANAATAQLPDPRFASNVTPLVSKIDACALPCFLEFVPKVCPNGSYDFYCQCVNQAKLTPLITPCVMEKCPNQQTQLHVNQITNQICNVVKADVKFWNNLSPQQQMAYTSKGPNSLITPIPVFATAPPISSYAPTMNGAKAMATGVPLVGAGLAALAFAL